MQNTAWEGQEEGREERRSSQERGKRSRTMLPTLSEHIQAHWQPGLRSHALWIMDENILFC